MLFPKLSSAQRGWVGNPQNNALTTIELVKCHMGDSLFASSLPKSVIYPALSPIFSPRQGNRMGDFGVNFIFEKMSSKLWLSLSLYVSLASSRCPNSRFTHSRWRHFSVQLRRNLIDGSLVLLPSPPVTWLSSTYIRWARKPFTCWRRCNLDPGDSWRPALDVTEVE